MLSTHPNAETLRDRISIAALIGETVHLVRCGDELRGQCTAHQDRERGLLVYDAKGLYHCFACGRRGDVVQWTRETARCNEEAAIAILIRRAELDKPDN
ncbi:CHC2 zinc finger domain-containing protein [Sphingobium sp.]|jgi:DNA primase|uniref:CHC2 zinc finger domain-containing protein n=1 Tax=Sphingobium sp. TaxID=1912891 RepID=UPI003BB4F23B